MDNINYAQDVFDNLLLRHKILYYVVYDNYKKKLPDQLLELLNDEVLKKWYLYCSCDICRDIRDNLQ